LTGKVTLVTGGSRGIGRATAEILAHQGAHVVLTYATDASAAESAVEAIRAKGGACEAIRMDVADPGSSERAVTEVAKRLGKLDVLVANAGISIDALLLRLRDEDIDRIFAVNVRGAIACARGAVKAMLRAKRGRIVFVSSVVGETGNAGQTAYAASKAALLGVAKSLAREYASRGITVNAVAPGYVDTDMTRALTDDQRAALGASVPLARAASPEDVAAAVAFLVSDEAGYITGQVLRVNGGMYM
jgi:3-oxoacyl-[acyl-carrier protein] reductase